MLTPNELVLTFGGCYLCAAFGENRSRSADRQRDRQTDTHTYTHTATEFIFCPTLNALAMWRIITDKILQNYAEL